ncbi:glycosyltransferase family 34 protein [Plenodomus tracheiphilus IPT5]|uniref:Glycosyltransferase family 34 protein n=1 Tax=Plenodomus tracheiphilus IPT5 TaxID=1408161 RepID=A0A6A7AWW8_9PLEO|nr:glycosyltransferase family 34 protein [Plenodomus tracheiphilus IPT5]
MPPTSLLPKLLALIVFLAAFYQLSTYKSDSQLAEHIPSTLTDHPGSTWFPDAIKTDQSDPEDDEDAPPAIALSDSDTSATTARDYTRTHIAYGQTQCMPHFDEKWQQAALLRNASCTKNAPFPTQETRRIGFASITTGEPIEAYQRAILTQMFHAAVHDTSIHILCDALTDGTFNKIAFLLHLVMAEMLKSASERLEWIMWTDRDAIVLDACRPLSSFLPPTTPAYDKLELIVNNDDAGLNNGIFLFKVSEWMVQYLTNVLSIRYHRPDTQLTFAEQSAMEIIMKEEDARDRYAQVPWYWFNAYPDEDDSVAKYRGNLEPEDLEWFRARKGDFIVHFAGDDGRSGRMLEWEDMLEQEGDVWAGETKRDVTKEVEEYWEAWKNGALTGKQKTGEDEGSAMWRKQQEAGGMKKEGDGEKEEKGEEDNDDDEPEKTEDEEETKDEAKRDEAFVDLPGR